jgi:hypothetical protein
LQETGKIFLDDIRAGHCTATTILIGPMINLATLLLPSFYLLPQHPFTELTSACLLGYQSHGKKGKSPSRTCASGNLERGERGERGEIALVGDAHLPQGQDLVLVEKVLGCPGTKAAVDVLAACCRSVPTDLAIPKRRNEIERRFRSLSKPHRSAARIPRPSGVGGIISRGGGNDEALHMATPETDRPIRRFRNGTGIRTDAILTGDFHRHDQLWGVASSEETTCWCTHILLPSTHHHINSPPFSSCLSKTTPHRRDKAKQTAISKEYFRPYSSGQVEILHCGTERNERCGAAAVPRQESH